jgi:hypothetical protein
MELVHNAIFDDKAVITRDELQILLEVYALYMSSDKHDRALSSDALRECVFKVTQDSTTFNFKDGNQEDSQEYLNAMLQCFPVGVTEGLCSAVQEWDKCSTCGAATCKRPEKDNSFCRLGDCEKHTSIRDLVSQLGSGRDTFGKACNRCGKKEVEHSNRTLFCSL